MAARWKSSDIALSPEGRVVAKAKEAAPRMILRGGFSGVILGIDPSLRGTGVAILRVEKGKPALIFSSTLRTKGTPASALAQIAQAINNICRQYRPDVAAIEETIYVQNNKTAITLGAARGAIIAALSLNQVECAGFAPARIKQAIVGYGRASKVQVAAMTKTLLHLKAPLPFDEADAVAAALCRVYSH
jgi:crossover junction endodeoxyribonuclease RuvC